MTLTFPDILDRPADPAKWDAADLLMLATAAGFEGVNSDAKGRLIAEKRSECNRCWGSGHYSYCPAYGTTCFRCGGKNSKRFEYASKLAKTLIAEERQRARSDRNETKAEERARVKDEARESAYKAKLAARERFSEERGLTAIFNLCTEPMIGERNYDYGGYEDGAEKNPNYSPIIRDIHDRLLEHGTISEKQIGLVKKIAAEMAATASAEVPEGKLTIEGKLIWIDWVDGDYGAQVRGVMLLDNGAKISGTVPAAIRDEALELKDSKPRVKITATYKPNSKPGHGWWNRPTKGEIVKDDD